MNRFRAVGEAGTMLLSRPRCARSEATLGRGRGEGVGAEVGEVAVVLFGADDAAEPVARLVEDDADASLLQSVGGGETGESSADDGYRCHAD